MTLVLIGSGVYLVFQEFWNQVFRLTTVQMLAMLAMIWAMAAFQFWAAEQRTILKYRCLVAVTVIVSISKPAISIFFVLHAEDKVTAYILGLAIVEIIAYTGLFITQMCHGKRYFSKRFWKYALRVDVYFKQRGPYHD